MTDVEKPMKKEKKLVVLRKPRIFILDTKYIMYNV